MSDSLWPHELQHARPPCPSPTPRVHSNTSIKLVMPSNHLSLCHPHKMIPLEISYKVLEVSTVVILCRGIMTGRRQSTWGAVCVLFFFLIFIWLCWVLIAALGNLWSSLQLGGLLGHVGSSSRTRYRTQTPFTGSRVLATGPPGKSPVLCLEMDAGYTSMCSVGENSLRTCALSNVSIIFNTSFPLIPHTATTYWQIRDLNFKTWNY